MSVEPKFYDPLGEELSKQEFVEFYRRCYYLYNSTYPEKAMQNLLDGKEEIKADDVIHILAWKMGKIAESTENEPFKTYKAGWEEYRSGWEDAKDENEKKYTVKLYTKDGYKETDLKGFVEKVVEIECEHRNYPEEAQTTLTELKNSSPAGIGTVYLITVLYFLSKGECPIYDRFAMMALDALDAIEEKVCPGGYVKRKTLPSKSENGFEKIMETGNYKEYIRKLSRFFKDEYKKKRDIDRALWVYGHLFTDKP